MPLNICRGNMFNFVTHTWNKICGECEHNCTYCYVNELKKNANLMEKYSGEYRLSRSEFRTD